MSKGRRGTRDLGSRSELNYSSIPGLVRGPPLSDLPYEGVLASNLPTTAEAVPFSSLGEEHPGVGPLYGDELLLEDVGRCGRVRGRGTGVSDDAVTGSRSLSRGRSVAGGGNGNANGNPAM